MNPRRIFEKKKKKNPHRNLEEGPFLNNPKGITREMGNGFWILGEKGEKNEGSFRLGFGEVLQENLERRVTEDYALYIYIVRFCLIISAFFLCTNLSGRVEDSLTRVYVSTRRK